MVDVLRTPDERFADLPGWPHAPRYTTVDGLRLARVDEGPHDADEAVLLVHGEPTWGFLYRRVVPGLLAAGMRVIVPDHVGFGRSDKPVDRDWYTYDRLVATFSGHLAEVAVPGRLTVVVHDWGGPIGLRWVVENAARVDRLVILNTGLYAPGAGRSEAFDAWQAFVRSADSLPIEALVQNATAVDLPPDVLAGYAAPFHDVAAQAGALALPLLVPTADEQPGAAAMFAVLEALGRFERPTLVLWGADDPIIPPRVGERFARSIPGASGLFEALSPAMHFLQEDQGPTIAERLVAFIGRT